MNKLKIKYKFLEHMADVKFQAFGKNKEEAFLNSALALMEVVTEKVKIQDISKRKIRVGGEDDVSLLYAFLEEFLYLLDAEDFVVGKIESLEIKDGTLSAMVLGDTASKYKFSNDVKAITYNEMFVREENEKWVAQVVLDV